MASKTPGPPAPLPGGSSIPRVLVATTAMLTFISFWRAAAIVLNDLASSAYYAGGEAEGFIGKTAPWFIVAIMLFSYAVRAIYVESCSMFVRGGVYRVVKEAMGGTLAKFSVSALMFDYILTGPISVVAAGQYLAGLINDLLRYVKLQPLGERPENNLAAAFAIAVTIYFWWQNIKGIPESSDKALKIMRITTVMVVILIAWCAYTVLTRSLHLPPLPTPANIRLDRHSMGWLYGVPLGRLFTLVAVFVGLGHSVLAMSGEESLAQVYREIESPKLPNLKKAGFIIFLYSLLFTGLVSVFAVMIIPDDQRQNFLQNLIGGLAMNLAGPQFLKLLFHAFVVFVGVLILSGAGNTSIVGANGVLNRVSEDGVLADWFRQPHPKFGTSYRLINIIVALQVLTIIISRGNVTFLADLYAFGVVWSFAMKGLAVLVLRYTHPGEREYRVPLNIKIGGLEIPLGLALITATLLLIAVVNLFTKPNATVAGLTFSIFLFCVFTASERMTRTRGQAHVEMDQFHVATQDVLSPQSVGARPGNILVPVSNYHALYHLASVLDRFKPERRDLVVLHVRVLRRAASGEHELAPEQLFGSIEQYLFTQALSLAEKRGKPIKLAVVGASDLWDGILRAAQSLESSTIVLGHSQKWTSDEQARQIGIAWERLGDPKPQFNLEIHTPTGDKIFKVLGPHAPNLTANEVNLLHTLWLRFSDRLAPRELHHHDVVHFALNEVQMEIEAGQEDEVVERLRQHIENNARQKLPPN
ncbi:MAG TPA: APC family permease [Candidatus Dormibacteraeota bacterium]|nr:APC family permease [Candidatus Dormibacteraeota bacterium]